MSSSELNVEKSSGWDFTAEAMLKLVSNSNNGGNGFTTLFAKDAFDLTIPKEDKDKSMYILDIAAGTGPLSIYGLKEYPNSKFLTTDFSPKMIEIVDRLIKENDLKGIETRVVDGQNLTSIESSTFDYTYSIFGLIFFPSIEKGLKEMNRVLKSGGKTAIASWCFDAFLVDTFQKSMDELLTIQNNGVPTKYDQVATSLADENKFKQSLESAGFIDCKIVRVEHPMEVNELTDITKNFKTNPAYLDCVEKLSDHLKPLFDETFIKYATLKNPPRSKENNKLQLNSVSFIGIGTKK